jgi:tetratricopeptide (TPR) repeat protein
LAGRHREAIDLLEAVAGERPELPEVWRSLATSYRAAGEYAHEVRAAERASNLRPDRTDYKNAWAESLIRCASAEEAIPLLRSILENRRVEAAWWRNLGDACALVGNGTSAIEAYLECLAIQPADAGAHAALGVQYGARGNLDSAVQELRTAVELAPDDMEFRTNLGFAYLQHHDYQAAAEQYEVASTMEGASADVFCYLGMARHRLGDAEGAVQALEEALQRDPHHPEAARGLELIRKSWGDRE